MPRSLLCLLALAVLAGCSNGDDVADEGAAHALAGSDGLATGLVVESVARGVSVPLAVADPDDGTGRLFVVDQVGQIRIAGPDGDLVEQPLLDLTSSIVELDPAYDERGLLGFALHPDFAQNGRFFVYYSAPLADGAPDGWDHTSHVSEFTVSADDPSRADPDSERVVMQIDQPYGNHNGGQIAFGPDGFLYIPLGDGGNGGDVDEEGDDLGRPDIGWGQTTESVLGSIVRIDIDSGDPYAVPADNVFAGGGGASEVFAYGFRNPYGLSFDLETGDLYSADAGQARYEEISLVEPGGNHGWNIREGTHCFDPDDFLNPPESCPDTGADGEPLVDPVVEYERGPESGSVVVPGVLHRGDIAELEGKLVFGDYGSIRYLPTGVLYVATPQPDGLWPIERAGISIRGEPPTELERFLLGVVQDGQGDLYLLTTREGGPTGTSGEVFAVVGAEPTETGLPWGVTLAVVGVVVAVAIGIAITVGRSRSRRDSEEVNTS